MYCTDYPILSQFSCAGSCVPAMFSVTANTPEILPQMQQPACPSTVKSQERRQPCHELFTTPAISCFQQIPVFSVCTSERRVQTAGTSSQLRGHPFSLSKKNTSILVFHLSLATGISFNFLLQSIQQCACTKQPGMPLGWRLEHNITGFLLHFASISCLRRYCPHINHCLPRHLQPHKIEGENFSLMYASGYLSSQQHLQDSDRWSRIKEKIISKCAQIQSNATGKEEIRTKVPARGQVFLLVQ